MAEFVKFDSGKPRLDLLSPRVVLEVGEVLRYGANKYSPNNWALCRRDEIEQKYLGAALRHIFASLGGERTDPETNLDHLAHAICSLMFVCAYHLDPSLPRTNENSSGE